jgi:spermidine/putrescine transport system ATP-binding protein
MAASLIQLKNINKSFGSNQVVKNLSLDIQDGEFVTLLGPSGCGKTTILRMLAGFETPDEGEIAFLGEDMLSIPANRRQVNTIFQSYALFPHLTVRENISFGLRMKKVPREEIDERVNEMLELTKLESLANRKPSQLSGGQQQRVAIARGLMNRPKVLLLDEPLGALDLQLRKQMQLELKRLQRRLGTTYVYVTHDQEEALTMSDRIVVMNAGVIEQIEAPREIYHNPATPFVAQFLGESNLFEGIWESGGSCDSFTVEGTRLTIDKLEEAPAYLCVRPEYILLEADGTRGESLKGVVEESTFLGQVNRVIVRLASGKKLAALEKTGSFQKGMQVFVHWEPGKACMIYER